MNSDTLVVFLIIFLIIYVWIIHASMPFGELTVTEDSSVILPHYIVVPSLCCSCFFLWIALTLLMEFIIPHDASMPLAKLW